MRLIGDLIVTGRYKELKLESVATDPVSPIVGQMWYNTTDGVYRGYDGTDVVTFANGGNTGDLQEEIDNIEFSVGLNGDGTYDVPTGTNYLSSAESIRAGLIELDTVAGNFATDLSNLQGNVGDIGNEITNIENGVGLNGDGTYTAPVGTNYISGATSVKTAMVALDTQAKTNADAIAANSDEIDTKVDRSGDSMAGNLAFGGTNRVIGLANGVNAGDAVNKAQLDAAIAGYAWKLPVKAIVADHTAIPDDIETGDRFFNSTDDKIYTATTGGPDGDGAVWDAGVLLVEGDAFFDKSDETGYVFNGTDAVQFTGGAATVAGIGLVKTGNVIDVNLGAGIGQLPTDEVGIDVFAAGGLFLTVDGSADSTDTAAQLSVKLDGSTLTRSASGVKISANGITATEIDPIALGDGLQGGSGTAISVNVGDGITLNAGEVEIDLDFVGALFAALDGATFTGAVVLAADPVTALGAATRQYVDAVSDRLNESYYLYTGSSAATHVVTHNISKYCNVTVVDSADKVIIPDSITFDSDTQLTVVFSSALSCKIVVTGTKEPA